PIQPQYTPLSVPPSHTGCPMTHTPLGAQSSSELHAFPSGETPPGTVHKNSPLGVGVGWGPWDQSLSTTLIAATTSSTVMAPSWFASPAAHVLTGIVPSAMFTKSTSSATVTLPDPSQSPLH